MSLKMPYKINQKNLVKTIEIWSEYGRNRRTKKFNLKKEGIKIPLLFLYYYIKKLFN